VRCLLFRSACLIGWYLPISDQLRFQQTNGSVLRDHFKLHSFLIFDDFKHLASLESIALFSAHYNHFMCIWYDLSLHPHITS
jgi:hypothetical protein